MSYKIIGKYIKDLKFNIPNPKVFFLLSKDISNYKINIDINSIQVKQNIIEVLTSLSLTPNNNNFEQKLLELNIMSPHLVGMDHYQLDHQTKLRFHIVLIDYFR